ncbi:MAG: hypothetical protein ACNA8W_01500 [Bradymonadaceae bacterium]
MTKFNSDFGEPSESDSSAEDSAIEDELFDRAEERRSLGDPIVPEGASLDLASPLDFGDFSEDSEDYGSTPSSDSGSEIGIEVDFAPTPGAPVEKPSFTGNDLDQGQEQNRENLSLDQPSEDELMLDLDPGKHSPGHEQRSHEGADATQATVDEAQIPSTVISSRPSPPKKPIDKTILLGIVAGLMLVGALIVVATSGSSTPAVNEVVPVEPVYRAPVVEVVNVRTSPPALRILVNGQSRGFSPVEVRLGEGEFPVTITARFDSNTELEKVMTEHEPDLYFDFSDLVRDR